MKKKLSIVFFGRKNCEYSVKIKNLLKKKCKKLFYFESSKINEKINLEKINEKYFDYILCFRSFFIIDKKLLKRCKKYAINFHPGTPEFRGIGSVNFALYNNCKYYGCTAHLISKRIDSGKIIEVKKFKLRSSYGIDDCLNKTYRLMYIQAKKIINQIFNSNIKLNYLNNVNYTWSNKISKKRDLDKLYEIKKNITKKELVKVLRATVTTNFKPYIKLFNKKFIFTNEKN